MKEGIQSKLYSKAEGPCQGFSESEEQGLQHSTWELVTSENVLSLPQNTWVFRDWGQGICVIMSLQVILMNVQGWEQLV